MDFKNLTQKELNAIIDLARAESANRNTVNLNKVPQLVLDKIVKLYDGIEEELYDFSVSINLPLMVGYFVEDSKAKYNIKHLDDYRFSLNELIENNIKLIHKQNPNIKELCKSKQKQWNELSKYIRHVAKEYDVDEYQLWGTIDI